MPKYIIERDVVGLENLTLRDLKRISRRAINAIKSMRQDIQWVKSYVTENKFYCEYIAENEETIKEHAKLCEFPVTRISKIYEIIDPTYAE